MPLDVPIGAVLSGYRIERELGRGSTGVVYLARDEHLDRPVALKVLPPDLSRDERFRARFLRESRVAGGLEHPSIVPIYAAGEADGLLYLAMRYVEGGDLRGVLERDGRLDPDRALRILRPVADALDAANGAKIVGGDSNTLLGSLGTHSVEVPGGGTARSPWMCVNSSTPSLRFFLRRVSGSGGLTIKGVVSSGTNKVTTLSTVSGASGTWQPSPVVVFPPFLTASATGINVQFQFTSDPGTVFHVDDVELDPYLRR